MCTRLNEVVREHTKHRRISQLSPIFRMSPRHLFTSEVTAFSLHSVNLFHCLAIVYKLRTFLCSLLLINFRYLKKIQCHVYGDIYIFLHSLTCLKMYYLKLEQNQTLSRVKWALKLLHTIEYPQFPQSKRCWKLFTENLEKWPLLL